MVIMNEILILYNYRMDKKYLDGPPGGPSISVSEFSDDVAYGPKSDIKPNKYDINYLKYTDGIHFTDANNIDQIIDFYKSLTNDDDSYINLDETTQAEIQIYLDNNRDFNRNKIITYDDSYINSDEITEEQTKIYLQEIKQNDTKLKQIMKDTEYGIYIKDDNNEITNTIIRKISKKSGGYPDDRYDSTIFTDTLYHDELSDFIDNLYTYMYTMYNDIEYYLDDNSITNRKRLPLKQHKRINEIQNYSNSDLQIFIGDKKYNLHKYPNIAKYINLNKTETEKTYTFTVKNYEGKNGSVIQKQNIPLRSSSDYTINKKIINYKYNFNYIYGFEYLFYKYYDNQNYTTFFNDQDYYLKSLPYIDYETIRDYTRPYTFEKCITPVKNGLEFKKSSIIKIEDWGKIGDSFSHFIYNYIKKPDNELEILTGINNEYRSLMGNRIGSIYVEYKRYKKDFIEKIQENKPIFDPPCMYHKIYTYLPDSIWTKIIKLSLLNLNKIIEKAPATKEPIILYRGSGSNYMDDPLVQSSNKYRTTQLSSFSYNFNAAYYFYHFINGGYANPNAVIYKLYVHKGVKVLLTTPFVNDNLKNEAEILIKQGQLLNFNTNIERAAKFSDLSHDCWNSINMANNIHLSDENKFRTIPFIELKPESSSVFARFKLFK